MVKFICVLMLSFSVLIADNQEGSDEYDGTGDSYGSEQLSNSSRNSASTIDGTVGYMASWQVKLDRASNWDAAVDPSTQTPGNDGSDGSTASERPFTSTVIADYDRGYIEIYNFLVVDDLDVNTGFEVQLQESAWTVPANYAGRKSDDATQEDGELYINLDILNDGLTDGDSHTIAASGAYETEVAGGNYFKTTGNANEVDFDGNALAAYAGSATPVGFQAVTNYGGSVNDDNHIAGNDNNDDYDNNVGSVSATTVAFGGFDVGNSNQTSGNTATSTISHGVENAEFHVDARVLMDWTSDIPGVYSKTLTMTLLILD